MSEMFKTTQTLERQDLLSRAEAIGRLAEEEAMKADQDAQFSPRIAQAIKEAQFHRLLTPKKYGGLSVGPRIYVDIIRTVARHNVAAAWLTYFYPIHEVWVAFLPPEGREEIFSQGGLVADVFTPLGKVEKDGNDYLLSGEWNFASGILWSDWVGLGALVELPDGNGPEPCLMAVPVSEVKIEVNWDTLGLRATGSNRVIVDRVRVPIRRILPLVRVVQSGKPVGGDYDEDEPIYRMPFFPGFLMGFPALAIGGAEKMLELFRERTEKRVRIYQLGNKEREAPSSQRVLAELKTLFTAAEALLERYVQQLELWIKEGASRVSEEEREKMFAWRAHIVKSCVDIAQKVFLTLGGTAIFKGDPAELFLRDLLTVATHTTHLYEDAMSFYGRTMFGFAGHPTW